MAKGCPAHSRHKYAKCRLRYGKNIKFYKTKGDYFTMIMILWYTAPQKPYTNLKVLYLVK